MKKETGTKNIRIYPSTHELLRRLAFKHRVTITRMVHMCAQVYGAKNKEPLKRE